MMISGNKVYFDYNATTPVDPDVIKTVDRAMTDTWGNPGSGHEVGERAREVFWQARTRVADLIKSSPEEVIFTSGGTESNNSAIWGVVNAVEKRNIHLITTAIEHPSLLNPCVRLLEDGYDITFIKPDRNGTIDPQDVKKAIKDRTFMVSVMLANNETGAIQPVAEIAQICRKYGVFIHTDAAQAIGKIAVDVESLGVDYLTIAGHKLYAPKGIGALYIKKGVPFKPFMSGGGQQEGLRPGTEPVPLAAGLGKACEIVGKALKTEWKREQKLREKLFSLLGEKCKRDIFRYSAAVETLPNTLCISFPGFNGNEILNAANGLLASTGAACHDRSVAISYVLSAMGIKKDIAIGTVRLSLGKFSDENQVEIAAKLLAEALFSLKREIL